MLDISVDMGIEKIDAARDLLLIRWSCIKDEEEKRKKMMAAAVELGMAVKMLMEEINR